MIKGSSWVRKPNTKYLSHLNHLLLTNSDESEEYNEKVNSSDVVKWEREMKEKSRSLEKNKTWVLAQLPEGKKTLQNK